MLCWVLTVIFSLILFLGGIVLFWTFLSLLRGEHSPLIFNCVVFNTVHDYSPCWWLALLTAACVCLFVCRNGSVRVHTRVFVSGCKCAETVPVCIFASCLFLFSCLLFVHINMWERQKWLFLSAVLLCERERKVSFNTQITALADKAAFHVGSNPQRQTRSHTLSCNPHSFTVQSLIVWASMLWDDTSKPV